MSPLTKILIVLLTLSSIFLCGIVVTYVGNADNYKEQYKSLKASRDKFSDRPTEREDRAKEAVRRETERRDCLTWRGVQQIGR